MGKNVCRDVGRVALQPLIGLCGERGDHSGEKTGLLNVSSSPKYNSGNATYKNKEIVQVFLPVVDDVPVELVRLRYELSPGRVFFTFLIMCVGTQFQDFIHRRRTGKVSNGITSVREVCEWMLDCELCD